MKKTINTNPVMAVIIAATFTFTSIVSLVFMALASKTTQPVESIKRTRWQLHRKVTIHAFYRVAILCNVSKFFGCLPHLFTRQSGDNPRRVCKLVGLLHFTRCNSLARLGFQFCEPKGSESDLFGSLKN